MDKKENVKYWMVKNPLMVDYKTQIKNVAILMNKKNISSVLVSENDKFIGIFTERDLVKYVATSYNQPSLSIEKFFTKNPICAQASEHYHNIEMKMKSHNIRHLPIMENNKLVGIVSMRDLLRYSQWTNS